MQNLLKLASRSECSSTITHHSYWSRMDTFVWDSYTRWNPWPLSERFPRKRSQKLFVPTSPSSASPLAHWEVAQGQDGTKLIILRGGLAINQFWKGKSGSRIGAALTSRDATTREGWGSWGPAETRAQAELSCHAQHILGWPAKSRQEHQSILGQPISKTPYAWLTAPTHCFYTTTLVY